MQLARSSLGDTAFDAAHRGGRELALPEAVRYALDLNDDDGDAPG